MRHTVAAAGRSPTAVTPATGPSRPPPASQARAWREAILDLAPLHWILVLPDTRAALLAMQTGGPPDITVHAQAEVRERPTSKQGFHT